MRVLFIARYRDVTMDRKVHYLARTNGLVVRHIRPAAWRDDLLTVTPAAVSDSVDQVSLGMLGRPADPHRALYRTLGFGLAQFRPDIIHAEEEPDSLTALQIAIARRLFAPKARLILNTWQNIDRPRRAQVRWVTRQTLRAASAVMCANREAQTILGRHGYSGYTRVLPAVGVDTEVFRPCPPRSPGGPLVVGYTGRLVYEKGLGTLLVAIAELGAGCELQLIGGGPDRAALEAQARALGVEGRVHFMPPVPPAQVAQHLCQLDVFVLPSITTRVWKEQFGRALTEAMACGVPVVGSSSGAIPEVIGAAGLIVPEGDPLALANCLRRLQESPELRRDLAAKGEARVREFYTQAVIARETVDVYRRLLSEPAGANPQS